MSCHTYLLLGQGQNRECGYFFPRSYSKVRCDWTWEVLEVLKESAGVLCFYFV